MRLGLLCGAVLLLFGAASVATAQVFQGENLLVSVPEGWEMVHGGRTGDITLSEFVPKGQTVDNWRQMITIQINHNMRNAGPKVFVDKMTDAAKKQVETGAFDAKPLEIAGDPGYATYSVVWVAGKVKATGKGEITLIRAIQGKDSLYLVQKAWRQAPILSPEQVAIPREEIQQGIDFLRKTSVVDTRK